ncbi:unnamed protein product, partial [Ixodes pacificus]
ARRVPRPSAAASPGPSSCPQATRGQPAARPAAHARGALPPRLLPLRVHFGKNRFPFAVKERVRNVEDKMSRAPAASSIRPAGAVGADLQDACLGTVFSEALPA